MSPSELPLVLGFGSCETESVVSVTSRAKASAVSFPLASF